ncbi:MAG: folate-binding protein [Pseudomonadota bacterium]
MSDRCIQLIDRRVLILSGEERKSFLQGLITNDVNKIAPERWLYAGLLTPQGKYLYDFFITEVDDALLLDCSEVHLTELKRKLMMYKLRSKVEISDSDNTIFAHLDDTPEAWQDPRHPAMGSRRLDGTPTADIAAYLSHRLAHGIPDGPADFLQDKTLWLETNADLLNGVDFEKGCYVGQELTARMRYRGKVRRRLIPVQAKADIPPGTPIKFGEREIGDVRSTNGQKALANLKVEDISKAPLMAGDVSLTPWLPDWLEATVIKSQEEADNGKKKEAV